MPLSHKASLEASLHLPNRQCMPSAGPASYAWQHRPLAQSAAHSLRLEGTCAGLQTTSIAGARQSAPQPDARCMTWGAAWSGTTPTQASCRTHSPGSPVMTGRGMAALGSRQFLEAARFPPQTGVVHDCLSWPLLQPVQGLKAWCIPAEGGEECDERRGRRLRAPCTELKLGAVSLQLILAQHQKA